MMIFNTLPILYLIWFHSIYYESFDSKILYFYYVNIKWILINMMIFIKIFCSFGIMWREYEKPIEDINFNSHYNHIYDVILVNNVVIHIIPLYPINVRLM